MGGTTSAGYSKRFVEVQGGLTALRVAGGHRPCGDRLYGVCTRCIGKEVHEKRPLDHEKKPFENLEVEDSHPMSWLARVRFGSCLA